MRCNWNSDHDWDPEANLVDVPYTQRYRTIVGDNVPEEVLGVFIETVTDDNEGGDVIMDNHTYVKGFAKTVMQLGRRIIGVPCVRTDRCTFLNLKNLLQ